MNTRPSPNFAYLAHHDTRLVALATQAEEHFAGDPTVTLFKLRQFAEVLAQRAAAKVALFLGPQEGQQQLLDRLWERNVIGATQRSFLPPPEPKKAEAGLHDELQRLRDDVASRRKELDAAPRAIEEARKAADAELVQRLTAEQLATKAREDAAIWEALATETAKAEAQKSAALAEQNRRLQADLATLQAAAQAMPPKELERAIAQSSAASEAIEVDEAATRKLIDRQLRDVGWEVDSELLTFERASARPAGRTSPSQSGPRSPRARKAGRTTSSSPASRSSASSRRSASTRT